MSALRTGRAGSGGGRRSYSTLEQKNGAVVWRLVGCGRLEETAAAEFEPSEMSQRPPRLVDDEVVEDEMERAGSAGERA